VNIQKREYIAQQYLFRKQVNHALFRDSCSAIRSLFFAGMMGLGVAFIATPILGLFGLI